MICNECETVAYCTKHGCIPKHQALDKMAENARELGLDYEQYKDAIEVSVIFHEGRRMFAVPKQPAPVQQQGNYAWPTVADYEKDVGFEVNQAFKMAWDMARTTNSFLNQLAGVTPKPAQHFFTHTVDQPYDWSEWVCPDPKGYLMKCCDCGLVHEGEFGVVRYKSATEREDCEPVEDPNLQAVFRMRRSEQWSPADTAHRSGGLPMEQPAQSLPFGVGGGLVAIKTLLSRDPCGHANTAIQMIDAILAQQPAQRTWVGLTDDEVIDIAGSFDFRYGVARAAEAKLKEKNGL